MVVVRSSPISSKSVPVLIILPFWESAGVVDKKSKSFVTSLLVIRQIAFSTCFKLQLACCCRGRQKVSETERQRRAAKLICFADQLGELSR